jgi:hypothetical protein
VGVFYAWDFLIVAVCAIVYLFCPPKIIAEKKEYVKFFLLFFSVYFFLFIVIINILKDREATHMLFKVCVVPALFISHLFYPFKTEKKNQHLSFFLFFFSLCIIGLGALIMVAFGFSNM